MSFVEASGHRLRKDRRQLTGPDSEQNVLWRLGLFNLGVELSINQHLRNITRVEMEAEAGTDACGHFHVGPLSR